MERIDMALRGSKAKSQSQSKSSRTSTPKVRTGCTTCKRRHIRCDEAKPNCQNCVRGQRPCGYASAGESPAASTALTSRRPLAVHVASPQKQALLDADCLDFHDATGARYFAEFAKLMQGYWITGTSNRDFWGVTAPQFARTNPFCRHAAMAIGALSIWYRESDARSLRARRPNEESAHYVQALSYHGRSLRTMHHHHQQSLSLHDASFLAVLLLFFDLLRGNSQAALTHVNHGLALVLALMTDDPDGSGGNSIQCLAPNPTRFFVEMADVFADIALQSRTILPGRVGHCTPLPNFARGLRSKKQTLDSFMVLLGRQFLSSPRASDHVPDVFRDLDEFENCLNTALRRHTAIGPVLMEVVEASGILQSNDPDIIDKYYPEILGNPKIKEYCETVRRDMQKLGDAFLPFFNRILLSDFDKPAYYLRAINLRLQYLGVLLFSDPTRHLWVESMQKLTPSFREYLSLVEIAVRKMKEATTTGDGPAHQMSLQCKLSYYVLIVAFFCRDPGVRDQAIAILADYPGRDGLWDTRALYALALRGRLVERNNVVDGTPDEQWRRLVRREFAFEDGGARILFRYLAPSKDRTTEGRINWTLVEEVADVSEGLEVLQWVPQPLTGSGKLLIGDLLPS